MHSAELIELSRSVNASIVPSGDKVILQKGENAQITQTLGGTYTVIINGNMFRIDGCDADSLGLEPIKTPAEGSKRPKNTEELNEQIQEQLKTVYDPEIPVNIVDLGLVYSCEPTEINGNWKVDVKMTLTAPGCGMGPVLQQDAQNRLLCIDGVEEVDVEIVWDPPWNQDMMTEAAKLQLGMM
ncbi:MAG: putative Fe-S cluster assembly protein SufT [Verrucomicrobiales bacterium]|nr:putative Fe-S cluster assembly protein SufT [Verrucomicrobiales bacterium]